MACHHSRSLWPQLPKGSPMQKTLQPSDTHCHHPPGKAHALTLPKALGAIPTFLRVTATTKRPAIMSSLLHPPLHGSSLLAKAPATKYCLQGIPIVPPLWKHMQTIHLQTPYQGVTAYTHWGKRHQASKQKSALMPKKKKVRLHKLPTDVWTYK